MSFFDILKGSLATLKANKLRTLLTMLGIIIGISSVIAMWAIGNGGRDSILGDLKKVGYGKFTVNINYKNENFKYRDYFTLDTVNLSKCSKCRALYKIYSAISPILAKPCQSFCKKLKFEYIYSLHFFKFPF